MKAMQFSKLQLAIIHQLSDGYFKSEQKIADNLRVSQARVSQEIKQLLALDLELNSDPSEGYQLPQPFLPLEEALIRQFLKEKGFDEQISMHCFATINSTNQYLKELPRTAAIELCCSEKQTQGRGRFGRQWVSPFGENIYLSLRWPLNGSISQLSGLSLVVGLAILESLESVLAGNELRIKWPNDILWNDKKLCGILIEFGAQTQDATEVIMGIGLNVNADMQKQKIIDRPACSLRNINDFYLDRNLLIAGIISHLNQNLAQFINQKGFAAFKEVWQKVDYLQDKWIKLSQPMGIIEGYARGVNNLGYLCLEDKEGEFHFLSSGETSLNLRSI